MRRQKNQKEQEADAAERERMYACWLSSVPGIGSRTAQKLFALCPKAQEIYDMGERLWEKALTDRQMEQIRSFVKSTAPEDLWGTLRERGIRFVMLSDTDYPQRLRDIPDPPPGLFVKGRLPDEDCLSVAVIGARDCSEYGKFVADGIGRELGRRGVQVISGMARGIDGISQEAALRAGGSSFGVLGCGVDICYPASNQRLYDLLCEQGGILSVHPPGTEARPQHFPPRNRIVSGLADALIVVEAKGKSGTLITVDMALEQGREVYAVPGRVTDRLSDGCNRLIEQGAGVFLTPEDFLRELEEGRCSLAAGQAGMSRMVKEQVLSSAGGREPGSGVQSREDVSGRWGRHIDCAHLTLEQKELCKVLDWQPLSLEQIQARLPRKYTVPELMAQLMSLCLENIAVQESPGQFCLRAQH